MVTSDCIIAIVVLWLQVVVWLQLLSYGCKWLHDCSCCLVVATGCMIAVVVCLMVASDCMITDVVLWLQDVA